MSLDLSRAYDSSSRNNAALLLIFIYMLLHTRRGRGSPYDRDHVAIRGQARTRDRIRAAVRSRWRMDRDESPRAVVSGQFLPSRPEPLFSIHRHRILE